MIAYPQEGRKVRNWYLPSCGVSHTRSFVPNF